MTHHAVGLWIAAVVMWGLTMAAAVTDVRARLFAATLGCACVALLAALVGPRRRADSDVARVLMEALAEASQPASLQDDPHRHMHLAGRAGRRSRA